VTNERKKQEKQKLENILVWSSCMANWVKGLPAGYKKMPFWPYTNSRL